ncbi:uncharacterized protein BCR38DRAFT_408889 [Pseudomassariella vexata]|uniref:Cytochrome P450 n=1 Tax=Pseudomassariella vexata TaxID=1141098 RepID=A0A1Y2E1D2_9PEZI|nr:uncharacterized protein BCR38DRAFT_408889 [Pseudomassariella vexata]ORY65154.1 hypothetical protein BCR38DRAFT_408889 [Pseudomassariella vexata]
MEHILKSDQNLELIRIHKKHGHFVRVSYDEVSVSHLDAIKKVLLAPLQACIKEALVSVSPWVIHYSKELWGPNASKFNPDCWLEVDATFKDKYWIPFGAGHGSCPRHNVAKIELSKITATFVRSYDIRQVHKEQDRQ